MARRGSASDEVGSGAGGGWARRLALAVLRAYKRFLSPLLPPACRFYPTCSEYCAEAIQRFGVLRGGWLGLRRVLRCQPLCKGGYDPVPPTREELEGDRDEEAHEPLGDESPRHRGGGAPS